MAATAAERRKAARAEASAIDGARFALEALTDARAGFDAAVAEAIDAGVSLRTLAEALGLTHEGVRKAGRRARS